MKQTALNLDGKGRPLPTGPAPARSPDTSAEAAAALTPDRLSKLRLDVFQAIQAAGDHGMTCDELGVALSLPHQTVSPRVWELDRSGHIAWDGATKRATRSGRNARVYRVAL